MHLSKYVVSSSPISSQETNGILLYSLLTNKLLLCGLDDYEKVKNGTLVNHSAFYDALVSNGFVTNNIEKGNHSICIENIEKSKEYPFLRVQIQPTYDCQLACTYCGQTHRDLYMSETVEDRLVAYVENILSSNKYKGLNIGWFGGEPTMCEGIMSRLTSIFRDICERLQIRYQAKLCTNGYRLSDELIKKRINELCLSEIQLTLDGPRDVHDKLKPTVDGDGSYDRILDNLHSLINAGANVRLRCNVSNENYQYVKQLIDILCENKIEDKLRFYIRSIYYWGDKDLKNIITPQEFARYEIDILEYMLVRGMKTNLLPKRVYRTCFAQDKDSFLVDPLGRLFNCDEVTPVSEYETIDSNKYQIGDLKYGVDNCRSRIIGGFHEKVLKGEYPCNDCIMYPTCAGLCHLRWIEGHKPCPSFKYNIKQRLNLYYKYEYSKNIT